MEALERAYLSAMSTSRRNMTEGRAIVQRMLDEHPNRTRARMFAAHFAAHENLANYGTSLRTLLYDVIPTSINDGDNDTAAMAFVTATKLATDINDLAVVEQLVPMLDEFWSNNQASNWRFACYGNIGIHYLRNGRLNDAVTTFKRILDWAVDPRFFCWLTKINAQLAVAYARLGNTAMARVHAELAENTGIATDKHDRLYTWGEIALAEGNLDRAKALFINAYRYAREHRDYYVMAYSQLMLARIFREIGNIDAFWYAYDTAHELSREHGIPHIFGVLAEIVAGIPTNVHEEVEHA